ncbi:unnamed protein product [Camellia sinensis]
MKKVNTNIDELYAALQGEEVDTGGEINMDDNVTPFAKAGFLNRLSFWWLNPFLKKGKEKILEDKEIRKLRQTDQAETFYFRFMEQLSKRKEKGTPNPPILSTIFFWQWKAILVSGFFALIKVLTLATSPMLWKAFIEVAQGKETFKYEGYAMTVGFSAKFLESLSHRQWYFRTRVTGLQVRSSLSGAIYKKQLQLSNAATTIHSPGEITNYVTVDAYRIGAQDRRLEAITETLTNMKILKLHAWENHLKNVIESLRRNESNYLLAVLSIKGYELVRINDTTMSSMASYLAESNVGAVTIRAFGEEERFFSEYLQLVDTNASSFFHKFSTNEWLIQRLEILSVIVLSGSVLAITLHPYGASKSDVRYRPNAPLVLRGISCIIEEENKIGIVGRTGSGKTTLISALFRLVEPTEGMIVIDDLNISTIGLHDLRSHFSVIPQDPTLFSGSVRYNLDPLEEHMEQEIWELFCLGRALLKRRKILVLDEATASIDNATDSIIQKIIKTEFEDCTVITVAHRIPTVMDCTMVLAISDGQLVEYD